MALSYSNKFPTNAYKSEKYDEACNIIKRWERKYSPSLVKTFVEDALEATRSPGKRAAYQEWLDRHQDTLELLTLGDIQRYANLWDEHTTKASNATDPEKEYQHQRMADETWFLLKRYGIELDYCSAGHVFGMTMEVNE